ncbi:glycosyl hydrolase family 28 protein [Croceibacterium sp. TMG7-5b_MA50]|uniref:glycoside hydrolase family 28 protein n=1 Tax=Croceibacterium sp. TMG7-5b_MA50 TaxID=3121290 RepID=UPI0032215967
MFPKITRRRFAAVFAAAPFLSHTVAMAQDDPRQRRSIADEGATGDGTTLNTVAIQTLIDRLAEQGGGTVVVPAGVFVSGALFFKPGVHLLLERDGVLQCSTDMANFPPRRTRIEGHFEESFTPALINADGCDGFRISGDGTLDGAGLPIWERFWQLRNAAPVPSEFPNLGVPRARLALIENSAGVSVEGVTFKDSQFWNLHLYKCRDVTVRRTRFEVPDDYAQAPSSDGIDLDSCQDVTIEGCTFSVTDDCIAAKGSKGPLAMEDAASPPVERIRVRDCHFRRGHHALACGSEATIVRDVVIENSRVTGDMVLARLKIRPDTPQLYEDIHFCGIELDNEAGSVVEIIPWTQYFDLKGQEPPQSAVRNITFSRIAGRFGALGSIRPNPGQTAISDITFSDINLRLDDAELATSNVSNLRFENVTINGAAVTST